MSEKARSSYARLHLLDGLRGIAAIAVALHHEAPLYHAAGLFPRAYLAVDFFFMLSGFVLTLAFEPKLRGGMGAGEFMIRRVARLWPVLAVGVMIGAAWRYSMGMTWELGWLTASALLLIPYQRGKGALFQLNGPQWSLAYEVLANAVHALVLRRLNDRLLLGFTLVCAAVLAWSAWDWGSVGLGDTGRNWWGGFARVGFGYGLGVWLGRQFTARQFAARRAGVSARAAWVGGALLPLTLLTLPFWPLRVVPGDLLAVFAVFPVALWCAAHADLHGRAGKMADALGRLSYPIYAIHGPVLIWGASLARSHGAQAGEIRALTLGAVLALATALAISPLAHGIVIRRKG